jgi:hypothetical protein
MKHTKATELLIQPHNNKTQPVVLLHYNTKWPAFIVHYNMPREVLLISGLVRGHSGQSRSRLDFNSFTNVAFIDKCVIYLEGILIE